MNIANGLSLSRLFSAPLFSWLLLTDHLQGALLLFVYASLTDAADGYVAKRFNQQTELGRNLDPLADKVLMMVGFITLSIAHLIPLWLTMIVVLRDSILIAGAVFAKVSTGVFHVKPFNISKVNTVLQAGLIILVLVNTLFPLPPYFITLPLWATALTTIASFGAYLANWSQVIRWADS
ncbi:MAG: CDP-alcohol phosphatidyltransferase family protein [Magnetococcales bacterium]|nr:CDP-alcohol phosphatidyltransferase family protein [Magnetococcales bacterium]